MAVYRIGHPEGYEWLVCASDADADRLIEVRGHPVRAIYHPISVHVLDVQNGRRLEPSDYPPLGGQPVFSRRAVAALGSMLYPNGELLPLDCSGGEYYLYNVLTALPALDEGRSELKYFSSSTRIMRIVKHVFRPDTLTDATIFTLPNFRTGTFVTDAFVAGVQKAGLTGFEFTELWSE